MNISLLTDATKHNLALMKLSSYFKSYGCRVQLNEPIFEADISFASVLFEWNRGKFVADHCGGPAYTPDPGMLWDEVDTCKPDYSLFPNTNYSLGFTFRPCRRGCSFCKVKEIGWVDDKHHSIWEFHDPKFDRICLLNNNTFMDPQWRQTFQEIWDADLSVIDDNGYDLRLLDDEKADALHRTKWATSLHFAWDRIQDEGEVVSGLKLLRKHKLASTKHLVYVLIGYDTTVEEDIHRCQVITDQGLTPYPMPFKFTEYTRAFKRFINLHYYRSTTVAQAWADYVPSKRARKKATHNDQQLQFFEGVS